MLNKITLIIIIQLLFTAGFSQVYFDPNFPKPTSGYGKDGNYGMDSLSYTNPYFTNKNIEIYYPDSGTFPVPTIFYSHPYGGNNSSSIQGMFKFIVSKGYAVVYVPYQTIGVTVQNRYENLLEGFRKSARDYPSIIDTTQVGFVGYSFGAGATFANSYKCFTENNWGSQGRFVYALAQWYSFNITQSELTNFPSDTKLIVQVFDGDSTNDHRMAVDVFNNINIPPSEKDFLLLKSDTVGGHEYTADHTVPSTSGLNFNAHDYYGIYRLLDALSLYTFTGSANAKLTALGDGHINQITMPAGLKSLEQTDFPFTNKDYSTYLFPCNDAQNPRLSYCSLTTNLNKQIHSANLNVYPNPFFNKLNIEGEYTNYRLISLYGKIIKTGVSIDKDDFSSLISGVYFIELYSDNKWISLKLIKE